ncbi:calcium/manganese antiporter SLC30A10 [Rhinophrynus dorsalis]
MGRYTGRTGRLAFMCVVSLFLFVAEIAIGYIGNSLSLSSDGFAVLSHLISMIIGLVGVRFSRVQWHQRNTYGFLRADVVGAFGNSVFAAALMFSILIEAIKRFIGPEKTENAVLVLIAGVVGLSINILNYFLFMDCCFPKESNKKEDLEAAMGRYTGKTCRLIFMLVLTVSFFVAELVSGYLGNSIALISDSFNMLSDLISLCVGITASRISRRQSRGPRATYGYPRAEVVGALSNAVFLTALCFTILVDSLLRLAQPQRIDNVELVLIVGALGLLVNIIGLLVFQDYGACMRFICRRKDPMEGANTSDPQLSVSPYRANCEGHGDRETSEAGDSVTIQDESDDEEMKNDDKKAATLNIRGVLLHVMGDALGSVVVVVAAVIFYVRPLDKNAPCNWQCYIDPSLTVLMVGIILFSAFPLIKETATILLQMVPEGVQVGEIGQKLALVPGVKSIHEIHIWELASGKNIATLHVKFQDFSNHSAASHAIRKIFHSEGIHAVTIQSEFTDEKDFSLACGSPCISKKCDPHLCCSQELVPYAEMNGNALKKGKSSQVWYRSNEINTDIEVSVEPLWEDDAGLKMRENANGFTVGDQTPKSTRF